MVERLAEDHANAQQLAQGLATIPGIVVDTAAVKTNIVFFQLAEGLPFSAEQVVAELQNLADIWLGDNGSRGFRAVTHYWIRPIDVERLLETLAAILQRERG
jgi:threonine aldolase